MSKPASALYLKDYQAPQFFIDKTELSFYLNPDSTEVHATLSIKRNPSTAKEAPLILDGDALELLSIHLNGQPLEAQDYQQDASSLSVYTALEEFELATRVRIYPAKNTALEGLYRSGGMYCTQCEAQGFRRITFYLDRPDVMSVFTTHIIANAKDYPVLLSNGNPIANKQLDNGLHQAIWHDPHKKPAYLFALVAGQLEVACSRFTTMNNKEVALKLYVEPQNIDKTEYALDALKRAMRWDEQRYGLEYDLDLFMIVAVDDFNMGAMENKGLNIFNSSCVLANPKTATDQTYLRIEAIVAHEYFHNWSGNRVTCRDWFQLSLKEGFTVFRDACFSAEMNDATVKRIEEVRLLRTAQFAEDAGPMAHPVQPDSYLEISNFYTLTIYEKGAELVRMLYQMLGEKAFYQGADLYFARHDGQAVTIYEFVNAMQTAGGLDLSQFMRWYKQAGTPEVSIQTAYNLEQQRLTLSLTQHTPDTPEQRNKLPVPIPVRLGLLNHKGQEYALKCEQKEAFNPDSNSLIFTQAKQQFSFVGIDEEPVVSVFRGFSAPVKVQFAQTDAALLTLMRHDKDGFNRWYASQQLLLKHLQQALSHQGEQLNPDWIDGAHSIIANQHLNGSLKVELLSLPSEAYLLQAQTKGDPQAIHQAHKRIFKQVAQALKAACKTLYLNYQSPSEYAPTPAQIQARSLKNWALSIWASVETQGVEAAINQFNNAANMTCEMAALKQIISYGSKAQIEQSLSQFYQQWKGDSLVLNQWFSAQSSNADYISLDKLNALLAHPDFTWSNPNKVRAVLGGFAQALHVFHQKDGQGYALLADAVIKLDAINPQIAARLLEPLSKWQNMAEPYAELMLKQLKRIQQADTLSKDVYEIITKSVKETNA